MTTEPAVDWERIRQDWRTRRDLTIADIARAHAVAPRAVIARAKADGWGLRRARKDAGAPARGARTRRGSGREPAEPRAARGVAGPVTRDELIARIYSVLERQLAMIEERIGDLDGEARQVNALIGNLQKIGIVDDRARPADAAAAGAGGRDINELRRQLVERIARLRAEWRDRMGGGSPDGR